MNLLVTGGCGFIGSNYIRLAIKKKNVYKLVNMDCLTYAGTEDNLKNVHDNNKYLLNQVDIANYQHVYDTFYKHDITHVVHFAAESHVDNSINGPLPFVKTNIIGTFNLLECARQFNIKKFHHVSTDEVYGELGKDGLFTEQTPYDPRNPYSATKASADHLVRAYHHTYGLPVVVSNCSNNYGPRQHKEKFIPTVIKSILDEDKIPVYGDGSNVRDWIYVKDHCRALWQILQHAEVGETFNVGAECEKTNLETIAALCDAMNVNPDDYIEFVENRKGHDFRYAIDNTKILDELQWKPSLSFADGIKKTVSWYVKHRESVLE